MSQLPPRLGMLSECGRTAPTASRVQQPRCTQVAEALATGTHPVDGALRPLTPPRWVLTRVL